MTQQSPRQLTTEEQQAVLEINQIEDFLFSVAGIQKLPSMDVRLTPEGKIMDERNRLREELKKAVVRSEIQFFLRSILDGIDPLNGLDPVL